MEREFSVSVDGGTVRARWSGGYEELGRADITVSADSGHEMEYTMRFPDEGTMQTTARVSSQDWYDGIAYGSVIGDDALDGLERAADAVAAAAGDAVVYTGPENREGRERIAERLDGRYDVRVSNATRVEAGGASIDEYAEIVARADPGLREEVVEGGVLQDAAAHIEDAYRAARERPDWMR